MFNTPPQKIGTKMSTRSVTKKKMADEQQAKSQSVTGALEVPPNMPGPSKMIGNDIECAKSCPVSVLSASRAGSIVKSERLVNKPPSQTSRHSAANSKIRSISSSKIAQKKKLELEAAKAKARIEIELIDKQLEADIANLEEEYSPPSVRSEPQDRVSDIEKWVERSQHELESQHVTSADKQHGMPQTSGPTDTDGPVQQLANALTRVVTSSAVQQNTHLLSRLSTPRDLPPFSGNQMEWLQFKQAYVESTEVCSFTDQENLWRLRKCLRGAAQEAVSALLVSGSSPAIVMSTLELQFGNADVILTYIMNDIKRIKALSAEYYNEIVQFSVKIKNYVAAVRALGRAEYLQGVEIVSIVLSKLPLTLISKWTDYSYPLIKSDPKTPRLVVLSDFLTEEAIKISTCSATLIQPKVFKHKQSNFDSVNVIETVPNGSETKCRYCRVHIHKLTDCKKFKKSLRKDRWAHVKRFGICYKCLVAHHSRETCPAATCDVNNCGQSHHRLLHYEPRKDNNSPNSEPEVVKVVQTESVNQINTNSAILLKVLPVNIHGPNGIEPATALLDDGSTVSLISASLAARAGLSGRRECLRVRGAWDNTELVCDTQLVNLFLSGADNKQFNISARVVNELNLPKQDLTSVNVNNYKHLLTVNSELCTEQQKPQILIGQDNYHLLVPLETMLGRPNEPCATRTPLGWCLHGRVPASIRSPDSVRHSTLFITGHGESDETETECILREMHEDLRRSFSIESMGISSKPRQNSEDLRAEKILEETATLVDGRWHVGLPWKDERSIMTDSYPTAISRLKGVEQKMKKNDEYKHRYMERIHHLFENDYARKLSDVEPTPKTWYLPHFGVDNPNKKKLRLVFDAAAKSSGSCLNDYLLKGTDLLTSLYGIMLRFRENPVAVTGDIKDMFLRIKIIEKDQNALRFLYKEPEGTLNVCAMTSLIFGANCSPFVAQYIKNKNAKLYVLEKPAAVAAICDQHYMDDYIDSLPSEQTAINLVQDIIAIHQKGGFEIRNFTSNSKQVLDSLPNDVLGDTAVKFKIGQQYDGERTLGLIWNPSKDTLNFDVSFKKIPEGLINGTQIPNKRDMLRIIMSIFDVYGFLAPFTVTGKLIMQETWKTKISWDESVPEIIFDKWIKWITMLPTISLINLPRHYGSHLLSASETELGPVPSRPAQDTAHGAPSHGGYRCLQLHIFCDASTQAMSAVAYWRWKNNEGVRVAFITSRCRVAPVKPVTVPRLELQAAVMAARLSETIIKEHRIKPERKIFWCDSSTVLAWIRNTARNYTPYIAHRLGEIDELTEINEWRYINTKLNVADVATRPCNDISVLEKEWMHGPTFLREEESQWPRDFLLLEPETKETELDMECINIIQTNKLKVNLPVPDASRFSSWLRLLRATAMVLKFINKCRKITHVFDDTMERAEVLLLKQSQAETFEKEITEIKNNRCVLKTSKLLTLSPYLDELEVLRVGGRIGAATEVLPETKYPIILDGKSYLAKLIVRHYHRRFAHANQEAVVNEVKQKYWITRLRPLTKRVTAECMLCRIRRCRPEVVRMGDLPSARLAHHQSPYTHCGLDLFGPMEVTVGRRREKRYGVLFTCMTIRAIHIELVASLTSDSLIMALRRMAARRSWPKFIYSDNGTNLRGAHAELKKSVENLDQDYLKSEALNHGTKWTFIPPASPHWGGAWERLIRSVKTSLKVVLSERAPRDETLSTLLAEVENMVNSRPLGHVSVSSSVEALTPNHFLIGSRSSLPIIGAFNDSDLYLRKQWRISQKLADMYWHRWVKEILPDLLPRQKWQEERRNLQVGDLVFMVDPDGPRGMWPRGRVERVLTGSDGRVRAVEVKANSKMYIRSVARVARIPLENE